MMTAIAELDRHTSFPSIVFSEFPEQPREYFTVDTEEKAAWAASRYLEAVHRIEERHNLATHYKDRIDQWLINATKEDADTAEFMRATLRPWAETAVRTQSRTKSVRVLGARIGLRKLPDRLELSDPELVLSFCEANLPEAVVIKKDVSKTMLKQSVQQGLVIPGVELIVGSEELTIKAD